MLNFKLSPYLLIHVYEDLIYGQPMHILDSKQLWKTASWQK